ncbi:hypothetical protein IU487_33050 [Nocardia puris]|uniref:Uncharacterized protein n=1 Tax=Nocardia puris TaxID=208602 RepID=A0A366D5R6_9NOCA|nr:hypothetical protein [Nocardia puris]MBF6215829.1 hypothetical protein [Nocardia puris]RBO85295.1 hypothetical protein DFR74_115143 [Nocardia puris]
MYSSPPRPLVRTERTFECASIDTVDLSFGEATSVLTAHATHEPRCPVYEAAMRRVSTDLG